VQSAFVAQVAGQSIVPPHRKSPQRPRPELSAATVVQVPLTLAPFATAHAWQSPAQAPSQHTPSTQLAVPQARQPATRQSPPAARSQLVPSVLMLWHEPSLAQYSPGAQ
jgi:hypothetical protein